MNGVLEQIAELLLESQAKIGPDEIHDMFVDLDSVAYDAGFDDVLQSVDDRWNEAAERALSRESEDPDLGDGARGGARTSGASEVLPPLRTCDPVRGPALGPRLGPGGAGVVARGAVLHGAGKFRGHGGALRPLSRDLGPSRIQAGRRRGGRPRESVPRPRARPVVRHGRVPGGRGPGAVKACRVDRAAPPRELRGGRGGPARDDP